MHGANKKSPSRCKQKKGVKRVSKTLDEPSTVEDPNAKEPRNEKSSLDPAPAKSPAEPANPEGDPETNAASQVQKKKRRKRIKAEEGNNNGESTEKTFLCSDCGFLTAKLSSLKIHYQVHTGSAKRKPRIKKIKEKLLCATCGYQANKKHHLQAHLKTHEPGRVKRKPVLFKCEICPYESFHSGHWLKHCQSKVHFLLTNNRSEEISASINCPDCDAVFLRMKLLDSHLEADHGYKLESEQLSFNSVDEVDSWLQSLQAKSQKYVKNSKSYKMGGDKNSSQLYYCHRQGKYNSIASKIAPKKLGSIKSGKACPSRVRVTHNKKDGVYNVTHWKTHVGHDLDPDRVPIPLGYKEKIASDLVAGMSRAQVMSKYRPEFRSQGIRRLTYVDIINIIKKFGIAEILKEQQIGPKPEESNPSAATDEDISVWELELDADDVQDRGEAEQSHPESPPQITSLQVENKINELMQLVSTPEELGIVFSCLNEAISQIQKRQREVGVS